MMQRIMTSCSIACGRRRTGAPVTSAVIALILPGDPPRTFRGTVEGDILREPRGSGGFGYDPLFFYPPFGATFAEIPPEQKLTVSHKAGSRKADGFSCPRTLKGPGMRPNRPVVE